jgi:hypothetical protein
MLPSIRIDSALRGLRSDIDIQLSARAYPRVCMTVTEMFTEDGSACGLAIARNLIIGVNGMGFSKGSVSRNEMMRHRVTNWQKIQALKPPSNLKNVLTSCAPFRFACRWARRLSQ